MFYNELDSFQYEGESTDGWSIILEIIIIWADMNDDDSIVTF